MGTVNTTIRAEMARRRMTQADVATELGLTQPAISARLRGRTDWRLGELTRLSELLGVPLDALLIGVAA